MGQFDTVSLLELERNYGRSRESLSRMPRDVRQAAAREVARRATAARLGNRQAVLKLTGYVGGARGGKAHLDYISRDGQLELEDDQGGMLDRDGWRDVLDAWASDFSTKGRGDSKPRNVMKLMLSAPSDADPERVREAARGFLREAFGGRHEYVFALHTDTDNPHVHAAIKLRGHDGKMMRQTRGSLEQWRRQFAEASRQAGIAVDASRRAERGVGTKAPSQADYHMLSDGRTSRFRLARIAEAKGGGPGARPWELAIRARALRERGEYAAAARLMQGFGASNDAGAQAVATSLKQFSEAMPEPRTFREQVAGAEPGKDPSPG